MAGNVTGVSAEGKRKYNWFWRQGNHGMEEDLYNPKELLSNLQMSEVILAFPDHLLGCGVLKYGENLQRTAAKGGCPLTLSHFPMFSMLVLTLPSLIASLVHELQGEQKQNWTFSVTRVSQSGSQKV